MRITILDSLSNVYPFELDDESPIEDLKALVEVDLNIPLADQELFFENKKLDNKATLKQVGIKDGDLIRVENKKANNLLSAFTNLFQGGQFGQQPNPQQNPIYTQLKQEALQLKAHYENNANDLQFILHQNPELAQAILNDDINVLIDYIKKSKLKKQEEKIKEMKRVSELNDDPFDLEKQRQIEEEIRMGNVNETLEFAQEFMPESFGQVTMLYIDCKINGKPIQAFVDSGAQSTIMSFACAEKCGIARLMDKRFAGMAMGVGTSRILGRIHIVNMQILDKFFQCSITILEDDKVDFLFGLDMLKRHQCCINLKKNVLQFSTAEIEVQFLSEGQITRGFGKSSPTKDQKTFEEPKLNQQKIENKQQTQTNTQPKQDAGGPKQTQNNGGFSEDKIKTLTDLGFGRNDAINALRTCGGNTELAASLLFQSGNMFN